MHQSAAARPRGDLAGGDGPAAAARAGTLGDGWLTGQNTPDAELVRQLEGYREAARAGRPIRAVLRRDIFVAETEAAAHAEVDRVLAEGYRGRAKPSCWWGARRPSSSGSGTTGR